MANYVRQTWTDGVSSASAARLGVIEDGIYDAHFQPVAIVYHSAAQAIANDTSVTLAFNSEGVDQDGLGTSTQHDNATNNSRLTCRVAGTYNVWWSFDYASNATGVRTVQLNRNGSLTRLEWYPAIAGVATSIAGSHMLLLAVNDYLEILAYQNSGGALNVEANAQFGMSRAG